MQQVDLPRGLGAAEAGFESNSWSVCGYAARPACRVRSSIAFW